MPVRIKDIMSKPVITIDINKTAKEAGELMKKVRKGLLVATKNDRPAGIITDSDMIKRVVAEDIRPSEVKVKDLMSSPLIAVGPDDDMLEAVRKMKKSNIHRLPVVKNGRVVGIVSMTDIARTSPEMLYLLEYRLKMKTRPFEIKEEFMSGICDSCGDYFDDLKRVDDKWLCESCKEYER